MRHLFLLRHAKAVNASSEGDFGRELAPRGVRQATRFGQWLLAQAITPDIVVASPARRTRETANLVTSALTIRPDRIDRQPLYNAEVEVILAIARDTTAEARSLMIVGHNPGIAELANVLAGHGDADSRARMARAFPTCACAVLHFDIERWSDLRVGEGTLRAFVTPHSLDTSESDD